MINWKKEGYKIDEEVCIVNRSGIYNEEYRIIKGRITYVGTKKLKVSIPFGDNEKTLEFNGRRYCNGALFGISYQVYKTEAEYQKEIEGKEDIKNLRIYITRKLNDIDN